jgi:undecaprenyl-diphosphatase
MEFVHQLIAADKWLFECVNQGWSNPVFDAVLPLFREKLFWAPFYLFVVSFAWINRGKKGLILIAGLVVAVGLADFTSSSLIKKNVQRLRPCNDPEMQATMQRRVPCGGGYSFTSSHAANHFAAAVFLIGAFGLSGHWQQKVLWAWAGSIALAQVYVGVHYPLDVTCGALLGVGIGWLVVRMFRRWV